MESVCLCECVRAHLSRPYQGWCFWMEDAHVVLPCEECGVKAVISMTSLCVLVCVIIVETHAGTKTFTLNSLQPQVGPFWFSLGLTPVQSICGLVSAWQELSDSAAAQTSLAPEPLFLTRGGFFRSDPVCHHCRREQPTGELLNWLSD